MGVGIRFTAVRAEGGAGDRNHHKAIHALFSSFFVAARSEADCHYWAFSISKPQARKTLRSTKSRYSREGRGGQTMDPNVTAICDSSRGLHNICGENNLGNFIAPLVRFLLARTVGPSAR
jgi:hypothetical protein